MKKKDKIAIIICVLVVAFAALGVALFFVLKNVSSDEKEITVYFVRHAKTEANEAGVLAGSETDAQLTNEGIEGAERTGEYLKNVKFDILFTSELTRTQDTAGIVLAENKYKAPEAIIIPFLNDINWGSVAGLTPGEATAKYPDIEEYDYLGDADDSDYVSPIGATTKYTIINNYRTALSEVVEATPNKGNALVVGHSSFIFLLQLMFPDEVTGDDRLSNASVTVMKYDDGKWTLEKFNVTN